MPHVSSRHMRVLQKLGPLAFESSSHHDWSIVCNTHMNGDSCIFIKSLKKKASLDQAIKGGQCMHMQYPHLLFVALVGM